MEEKLKENIYLLFGGAHKLNTWSPFSFILAYMSWQENKKSFGYFHHMH